MATRTRPLRTTQPQHPTTQGERIRYARIQCNLTQQQLAMGISRIARTQIDKATISKWENDNTSNPTNTNLLGLQAVTGFAATWIVRGEGELLARNTTEKRINEAAIGKALGLVFPAVRVEAVKAVITLYELIEEAPDVSTTVLQRTADALLGTIK